MASLLRTVLFCVFMASLSLLLLHDVAARELAETRPAVTSSGGRHDDVSSVTSRRGRETNEVQGTCEYVAPISYCCHIYEAPMCFYSLHDCLLNCVMQVPPAKH